MKTTEKRYAAPQVEVIAIEPQGILCTSGGGDLVTNAGGGTTPMTMTEIQF
jgi:hypothetical protein